MNAYSNCLHDYAQCEHCRRNGCCCRCSAMIGYKVTHEFRDGAGSLPDNFAERLAELLSLSVRRRGGDPYDASGRT